MRYKGTRRKDYLSFDVALALPCTDVVFDKVTITNKMFLATEVAIYTVLSRIGIGRMGGIVEAARAVMSSLENLEKIVLRSSVLMNLESGVGKHGDCRGETVG